MNSMLNYVISNQQAYLAKQLLLGPAYLRLILLLVVVLVLSMVLINQYITDLWDSSNQLDHQFAEINSKLVKYEQQRDKIINDYEAFISTSQLIAELEKQFSSANSEDLESWLIQTAVNHQLQPSQIHINTQLVDDQGKFFRVTFKLSGSNKKMQAFLEKILHSDFFLIWEELIFEALESNRLSLTILLKQYTDINDKGSV